MSSFYLAYQILPMTFKSESVDFAIEGFFNLMIIKANIQASPVLEEPRFREWREQIGQK